METKAITQTAIIGNTDVSRRALLLGLAAATTTAAVAVSVAPDARSASTDAVAPLDENPKLVAVYGDFLTKRAELAAAQDALEWLADEWRHRWPLAPEEILGCQNASLRDEGERDIIGRPIERHRAELTKRLSAKLRSQGGKSCFEVLTPEEADKTVEYWIRQKVRGRTPAALERNAAFREEAIAKYKHRAALAHEYHAETARLRQAAGADIALERVRNAKIAVFNAAAEVSFVPALTVRGLEMRIDALLSQPMGELLARSVDERDWLGQFSRFVQSIQSMKLEAVV